MRTTCKPERFGNGEHHQGIQIKIMQTRWVKRVEQYLNHIAMKVSKAKNAETGVTSVRSMAGECFRGIRIWLTQWQSGKLGFLSSFTFPIIHSNYVKHKVLRRLHSFRKVLYSIEK